MKKQNKIVDRLVRFALGAFATYGLFCFVRNIPDWYQAIPLTDKQTEQVCEMIFIQEYKKRCMPDDYIYNDHPEFKGHRGWTHETNQYSEMYTYPESRYLEKQLQNFFGTNSPYVSDGDSFLNSKP